MVDPGGGVQDEIVRTTNSKSGKELYGLDMKFSCSFVFKAELPSDGALGHDWVTRVLAYQLILCWIH